jgi:hypothetical protein
VPLQSSVSRLATLLGAKGSHDNARPEYAYGPTRGLPNTHVGTFSEALLTQANKSGWNVISMKNAWKRVFALGK